MLEARSLCSGASGRNGGHIKPDCYKHFTSFQKKYGTEEAIKLCKFEMRNMRASVSFIKEQGLAEACDLVETRAVDVFMTADAWKDAKASIYAYTLADGPLRDVHVHERDEFDEQVSPAEATLSRDCSD